MPKRVAPLRHLPFCVAVLLVTVTALADGAAAQPAPECRDAQSCRDLALDARARGAYETFHDLAWRALQTSRPNDPDAMYLVARAQSLSGRRRDAAVMLRRLAEAGYSTDAETDEDFRRVRETSDWQLVMALTSGTRRMTRLATPPGIEVPAGSAAPPPSAPSPTSSVTSQPSAAPVTTAAAAAAAAAADAAPARTARLATDEAVQFSAAPFTPGGLAYDAVSRRFLFGDRVGRRLFVVGEGSDRAVDLVRGESAGFEQVTAIAIDPKRGDLWVAAASADGGGGALHHLQLISGRVLAKLPVPGAGQARLTDIAVAGDGRVFVLDSAAPRLLTLRPGATALEPLMPLTMQDAVSITVDDDGRTAYVANREGIARVDLQARRAVPLNAANGITLSGFDFVRLHRDALVGSQLLPDKSRGLVRLRLNGDRRTVTEATLIETPAGIQAEATPATVSGGDLYYVVAERGGGQDGSMTFRVNRIKLP